MALRKISSRLAVVCLLGAVALGVSRLADTSSVASAAGGNSIYVSNQTWTCSTAVHLDSVTVSITNDTAVGVRITKGCTGSIGSLTVTTSWLDGVHVNSGAHDLTIGGGTVTCTANLSKGHQDGVQVMSGTRITFSKLTIGCATSTNAGLFINWAGQAGTEKPTDVVCDGCRILPTHNSSVFVTDNVVRSGIRNSTICPSRLFTYRKGPIGKNEIDVNNTYPKTC